MATDLSLPRLRELLQSALTLISEAFEANGSILTSLRERGVDDFSEWWKANQKVTGRVIINVGRARQALANGCILCDHNELVGDAEHLRHECMNIAARVEDLISFHKYEQEPAPTNWDDLLTDLCFKLNLAILSVGTTAESLLESLDAQKSKHEDLTQVPIVRSDAQLASIEWAGTRYPCSHNVADAFRTMIDAKGRSVGLGKILGSKPKRAFDALPDLLQRIVARDGNKGYRLIIFD